MPLETKATSKLLDAIDEGMLTWQQLGEAFLATSSEDDIKYVTEHNELLPEDEEEE